MSFLKQHLNFFILGIFLFSIITGSGLLVIFLHQYRSNAIQNPGNPANSISVTDTNTISAKAQLSAIIPKSAICNQCNIALIDLDILRADALPCYGYDRNTAPNLCAFARNATLFTDNYSTSYWTLPSMFSTLTSLLPIFHRVQTAFVDTLSPDISVMAEELQKSGYQTMYVGTADQAMANKINGGFRGFDQVIGIDQSLPEVIASLPSNKPWFIYYYQTNLHMPYLLEPSQSPIENLPKPPQLPLTQDQYNQLLNIYLKKHYADIFLPNMISQFHSIIFAPTVQGDTSVTNLFQKYSNRLDQLNYLKQSWDPLYKTYMETFDSHNPNDVAYIRMLYDTLIQNLDQKLAPAYQQLATAPFANNTITIVTSDHGEAFGEHGTFTHDSNHYSELFHTPLIIHLPKGVGQKLNNATSNIDIFPTVFELLGLRSPDGLQGQSLVSVITGHLPATDRYVISQDGLGGIILQNRNWLYFLPVTAQGIQQSELYDKNSDPKELKNVTKEFPTQTQILYEQATLLRSYDSSISAQTRNLPGPVKIKIDPAKLKQMQIQGYF